ncbi:MAG TPA: flagellar biosynthesis anti-sigma factor FlgM [Bacillales bacterium]|jgi:negative regulator of flagellin synthesis FlgM|nr:flagellar biosynthesis anti-sigma factor FlgM [Bacillales bacterium]
MMKINGVNHSNYHPYKKTTEGMMPKNGVQRKDRLEISAEAKHLQHKSHITAERQRKIDTIKNQIENGQYKVDVQQTAKKFYEFWMKK